MNLEETDYSQQALTLTVAISKGVDELSGLMEAGTHDGPRVDKLLVALLVFSRKLLDYIDPVKSTGEIHGLPKAMTDGCDRPAPIVYRKQDPEIDFGPWWQEKTSRIHAGLFKIAMALSLPHDEVSKSLMDLHLSEIRHLTGGMVDLLNAGGLVIREIRMEEDEEDDED